MLLDELDYPGQRPFLLMPFISLLFLTEMVHYMAAPT